MQFQLKGSWLLCQLYYDTWKGIRSEQLPILFIPSKIQCKMSKFCELISDLVCNCIYRIVCNFFTSWKNYEILLKLVLKNYPERSISSPSRPWRLFMMHSLTTWTTISLTFLSPNSWFECPLSVCSTHYCSKIMYHWVFALMLRMSLSPKSKNPYHFCSSLIFTRQGSSKFSRNIEDLLCLRRLTFSW